MTTDSVLIILTFVFGFYMAWNIGANDLSNAMGTSVGSKALTLQKAIFLAAILEFSGAVLLGSNVSSTIQQGIVDPNFFSFNPIIFVLGMIGALLATGLWINLASYLHLPVSTTHAIVGAVLGFGILVGGIKAIHWHQMGIIALSWIISPLISSLLSFTLFHFVQQKVLFDLNPFHSAKKLFPYFIFFIFLIFSFNIFYKGPENLHLNFSLPLALLLSFTLATVAFFISLLFIRNFKDLSATRCLVSPEHEYNLEKVEKYLQKTKLSSLSVNEKSSSLLEDLKKISDEAKKEIQYSEVSSQYIFVEKIFAYLQIISACLVAFAHGSNDVANSIGPLAAVIEVIKTKNIPESFSTSLFILFFGGISMVIGLATWGWRVIETVGKKITELTPTRGFSAEIATAFSIIVASKLGLPISTTHALVGSVLGVGFARGLQSINLKTLKDILLSWFVTIPLCALLSIFIFYMIKFIFF